MFGSRWCDVAMASERSADFSLALLLASSESMILVVQFLLACIETGDVWGAFFDRCILRYLCQAEAVGLG